MRESWFLQQLHHPHIAHLLHQYMSPNSAPNDRNPTYYFVQEDCGQNLMEFLRNRILQQSPIDLKLVPLSTIENVLRGLLSALVCLERYRILHRDIKEDNCLIFGEDHFAKLIDFGLAKKVDPGHSTVLSSQGGHHAEGDSVSSAVFDADPATDSDPDDQSKLFQGSKQYAPESWVAGHGDFTYKSDLWAVGTMVIWPLLFWACRKNLAYSTKLAPGHNQLSRKFPFPSDYPTEGGQFSLEEFYQKFTKANLHELIKEQLLDKFEDQRQDQRQDQKPRFQKFCHILEHM